ncbi:hypothetical protein L1887_58065 [Cichorium endivia]|nr:hypothetical protein L1887_58065 [Cichorium endivia]
MDIPTTAGDVNKAKRKEVKKRAEKRKKNGGQYKEERCCDKKKMQRGSQSARAKEREEVVQWECIYKGQLGDKDAAITSWQQDLTKRDDALRAPWWAAAHARGASPCTRP